MWNPEEERFIDNNQGLINEGRFVELYAKMALDDSLEIYQKHKILSSLVYLVDGVKSFHVDKTSITRSGNLAGNILAKVWVLRFKFTNSDLEMLQISTILPDQKVKYDEQFREAIRDGLIRKGYSPKMAKEVSEGAKFSI